MEGNTYSVPAGMITSNRSEQGHGLIRQKAFSEPTLKPVCGARTASRTSSRV